MRPLSAIVGGVALLLCPSKTAAALAVYLVLAFSSSRNLHAAEQEDDGGFHTLSEFLAQKEYAFDLECENVDDVFDTKDIAQKLASATRVRLFRVVEETDELFMAYWYLARKPPLKEKLGGPYPTVEIAESAFRPVLSLASDSSNYGCVTMCMFHADVALLIGEDEPKYILVCCFTCHDIHVIRRPTKEHPMPRVAEVGMSPELERAIFDLARTSYPNDKTLQEFKLAERKRSKTPLRDSVSGAGASAPSDPFASPSKTK